MPTIYKPQSQKRRGGEAKGDDSKAGDERRAPMELMTKFLSAVSLENYVEAQRLCEVILKAEPDNAMILEYRDVLERQMKAAEDDGDDDDEEDEDEEDDENSDEHAADGKAADSDDSENEDLDGEDENAENNEPPKPVANATELPGLLAEYGLTGSRAELAESVRWIKDNCPTEDDSGRRAGGKSSPSSVADSSRLAESKAGGRDVGKIEHKIASLSLEDKMLAALGDDN